jgi:hypothetical protein
MNDPTQPTPPGRPETGQSTPTKGPAAQAGQRPAAASASSGAASPSGDSGGGTGGRPGEGGGYGERDGRPKSDPILTQRFENLDKALHGTTQTTRAQKLNWSGDDEPTVAFDSLEQALEEAVPVDRPTSDLSQTYGSKRAGG